MPCNRCIDASTPKGPSSGYEGFFVSTKPLSRFQGPLSCRSDAPAAHMRVVEGNASRQRDCADTILADLGQRLLAPAADGALSELTVVRVVPNRNDGHGDSPPFNRLRSSARRSSPLASRCSKLGKPVMGASTLLPSVRNSLTIPATRSFHSPTSLPSAMRSRFCQYSPSSLTSTLTRPVCLMKSSILTTDRWHRRKFSTPPTFGSEAYCVLQKLLQRQPDSLVGTLFPLVVEGKKAGYLLNPKFACSHPSPGQVGSAMTCNGATANMPRPAAT